MSMPLSQSVTTTLLPTEHMVAINRVQGVSRGAPLKVSNESEAWSVKRASIRWDIIKI